MYKFSRKILIALILSFSSLVLVNYFVWESYSQKEKFNKFESSYLVKKHNQIHQHFEINEKDRLFFGTSKIFRHFDPEKFDSIVGDGEQSFNYGHAALFPFRLLDYTEFVLKHVPRKFQGELFIELTALQDVNEDNYNTTEIQSSLNIWRAVDFVEDEKYFRASHFFSAL
jgi:hypothetical protein